MDRPASRWAWSVPLLVVLALALAPAVQACGTNTGQIFVPTGTPGPPPLIASCASGGLNVYCVPANGLSYTLAANAPVSKVCLNTQCLHWPDFNVAWYAVDSPFDKLLDTDDFGGNQGGAIPGGADYGLVYMRHGPDVLGDDSVAGKFTYVLTC